MEIKQDLITIIAVALPMVIIAALAFKKRSNTIPPKTTTKQTSKVSAEPIDDHLPLDALLESYDEMDPPAIYEDELDMEGELVVEEKPKKTIKPVKKNSKEKLKVISKGKDKVKSKKKVK